MIATVVYLPELFPVLSPQGKSDVGKEILYADRAKIFPWRPRVYPANRKLLMYSAIAQALFLAYGVFNPSLTLPIVYGAGGGGICVVYMARLSWEVVLTVQRCDVQRGLAVSLPSA